MFSHLSLSHRNVWRVWLFVLAALGCFAMLFALNTFPGLNGDEAFQGLRWEWWFQPESSQGNHNISGRYANYVLVLLIKGCQLVWGNTIWSLRLPTVILTLAGLLALFLCARKFHSTDRSGLYLLAFLAHPLLLGYARIGWEPSGALVGAVLVWFPLFLPEDSLPRWQKLSLIVMGCALTLLAHPLFLINLLGIVAMVIWRNLERLPAPWPVRLQRTLVVIGLLPLVGMIGFLAYQYSGGFALGIVGKYVLYVGEIFSGVRIFQYVVGTSWGLAHTAQAVGFTTTLVVSLVLLYRHERETLWFTLGAMGFALAGFFVIQPKYPINLGNSRFLLFFLCLVCFLIARGATHLPIAWGRAMLVTYALVGFASFGWGYFAEGWKTENHQAARAFWSGSSPTDPGPKVKAAKWLKQHTSPQTVVMAGNFWIEKPLRYFLGKRIHFYWHPARRAFYPRPWRKFSWAIVGFVDEPGVRFLHQFFKKKNIPHQRHVIRTKRGREQIVILYHPFAKPAKR